MAGAFDAVAFDDVAFDVGVLLPDTNAGGGLKKHNRYLWRDHQKIEEDELKLSQLLAQQLQEANAKNEALAKALLEQNNNVAPVVDRIARIDPAKPTQPPKPPMDPRKKAELMRRLEAARQAKIAKQQTEAAKRKQMLDNLAKARKAKAKKNR